MQPGFRAVSSADDAQRHTIDSTATLARLHDSGMRHVDGEALGDLLVTSLAGIVVTLRAAGGYVVLLESDARQRLVAATGEEETIALLARRHAPASTAADDANGLADGARIVVEDVATATGLADADRRHLQNLGITTLCATPLSGRRFGRLGTICTFALDVRTPGSTECTVATLIARQTADFIEAASAGRELRQQSAANDDALSLSEASNLRKDQFLATLSHELRQPLAAAISALEVQKRSLDETRRARAGEIITEQLRQMLRLVEDIRNLSSIGRGTIELRRERLDIRAVVQQAVDATSAQFDRKRQRVVVSVGVNPVWIAADNARLTQVFSNLLQNAAAYTPAGGKIRVTLTAQDRNAQVCVIDNGIGIASDALSRIFDLFERGAPDHDSLGLGIGLAVVRQLVELHGGAVHASSNGAGTGSEFVVTLPIAS
jgi:signal transduction histidine kinase